jgi:hypothetical protein
MNAKLGSSLFLAAMLGAIFCVVALLRYSLVMIFAGGFAASAGDGGFLEEVTLSSGTIAFGLVSLAAIAAVFTFAQRERSVVPPAATPASAARGFAIDTVRPKLT